MRRIRFRIFGLILTLVFSISQIFSAQTSSGIAFPTQENLSPESAPFLATLWRTQANAPDEIEWNGGYLCGAVLLNRTTLVTAAHCVVNSKGELREDVVVMAGEKSPLLGDALSVFEWKIHPRFSLRTGANDVAVAILNHESNFGPTETINIASKFQKGKTWLYGWGMNQNRQKPSTAKRILQDDYTSYGDDYFEDFNSKTMIAAGYQIKNEKLFGGACFGDSGSPLVIKNGNKIELLGIVSNGTDQCDSRVPSVYTRMSYYKSFIEDSIKKSQTSYKNLGLTKSYERDFYPGYLEIAKGKVLPFFYDAKRKSNVTTVALQTTSKANSFAYSDIFQIQFEAFGARGSSDHRWLLRVYLRAGKDACDLRAESETRISIGSGIPTYLSYTFLIPRERGKCFDITNKNQFISTAKSEWFSVAPGDKAMFDQMKCDYPSYRPMMMTEFWAEADPTLVGGWEVIIDPRCQKATSFGPFVRTYHYNYRTQMSDTEPGLGMWIGTFRTEG